MSRDAWFNFFALLTLAANAATVMLWALFALRNRAPGAWSVARASLGESGLAIATVVAGVAMAGSLYLSEGANLPPCKLCWYQRIAMYSLAVVLLVATVRRDWGIRPYVYVVAGAGGLISVYHYLVERFPDLESGASCDPVVPCTVVWIWKFHYVSIPFMALSAFVLVVTVLLVARPDAPARQPAWNHEGAAREV